MAQDQRFHPKQHIRSQADFARVYAVRCRQSDDALTIYVADNGLEWSRLGLSIGKRVGNAVRRNYVRRRIREAFRTSKDDLPSGLDIVCVARPSAAEKRYDSARALRRLVSQAARRLSSKSRGRSADADPVRGTKPAQRQQ